MPDLLFIYGTLHPDCAPAAIAATARRLRPVGRATIRGWRYELGEYPGVVLDQGPAEAAGRVAGELFLLPEAPDAAVVLGLLDAYEDFRPADPVGSLFVRQRTLATLEDGTERLCWVYTYNQTLPAGR